MTYFEWNLHDVSVHSGGDHMNLGAVAEMVVAVVVVVVVVAAAAAAANYLKVA